MVILAEGFLLVIFFRNKLALLCNTKCRSKVLGLDSNERQINMRHKDQSRPCELHGHLESHSFRELSASLMFSVQPYKETGKH